MLTEAPMTAQAPVDAQDPPQPPLSRVRMVKRAIKLGLLIFLLILIWLMVTAPLSRSLGPIAAPSLTILSAEGEPIARRGSIIGEPVDVSLLPPHVAQAFIAIEDRRFYTHSGLDPWGMGRAMWRNFRAGRWREGGSTITQQLAKTSFLSPDRTFTRKAQEALIALWLEARLSKTQILSRYLSNVYFGDNVYGLRAAARHYFNVDPGGPDASPRRRCSPAWSTPRPGSRRPAISTRRAPAPGWCSREMVESGFLTEEEARRPFAPPGSAAARATMSPPAPISPTGCCPQRATSPTRAMASAGSGPRSRATCSAPRSAPSAAPASAAARRPWSRCGSTAGSSRWSAARIMRARPSTAPPRPAASPARRSSCSSISPPSAPGSTPDTPVDDRPIRLGDWTPRNYGDSYRGRITLRDAVAHSSNSVAVQVSERVGRDNVIRAARDLGVTTDLRPRPSLPLGVNNMTLLELTQAYAAVASGRYPIRAHGLPAEPGWFGGRDYGNNRDPAFTMLRDVLYAVVQRGTGRAANLSVPTFGKTGTTSDYRDALFVGFAGDLVVGVWIGNDDNSPLPGTAGGGLPARIWRSFMADALGTGAAPAPAAPVPLSQADQADGAGNTVDSNLAAPAEPNAPPPVPPDVPEVAAPPPTAPKEDSPPEF